MIMINNEFGYLYIRVHEAYNKYKAVKLGITECIINRDKTYKTEEIKHVNFKLVIQIPIHKMKLLQNYFKCLGLHIIFDGGTEFFSIDIINLIIPFMEKLILNLKLSI